MAVVDFRRKTAPQVLTQYTANNNQSKEQTIADKTEGQQDQDANLTLN